MPRLKHARRWLAGFVIVLIAALLFTSRMSSHTPVARGIQNGRLAACPESPNCVCSYDTDSQHTIEPLRFSGEPVEALAKLKQVISAINRTTLISESTNYLHVEFRTAIFRFVDDVEFLLDPAAKVIHVRSASRVGHSDLGTNRRRIEFLRSSYNAANP